MQNFIYSINSNSRGGAEPAFSNLTFDLTPPEDMIDNPVIVGGTFLDYTYRECQKEMDLINKAFYNIMYNGDAAGKLFSYPIPTYNIHKRFDWDNPNNKMLWEMAGKYGTPYFANFINSDLDISDIRSMCCRLAIRVDELRKRNGGLFGSGDSTGCYDEKTEILTGDGWKFFKDLTIDDNVYTLSPEEKIELHRPIQLFKYDWDGDLIKFKNDRFDLLVTPNHRMVYKNKSNGKIEFVRADEYNYHVNGIPKQGEWEGNYKEYFELPSIHHEWKGGNNQNCAYTLEPLKIKMDSWLKFLGIFLSEGSYDNDKAAETHGYRVQIAQKKHKKEVEDLLKEMPFKYRIDKDIYTICNKQLWSYMRQFGHCYYKYIPREYQNLAKSQLKILFDYLMLGDGTIRKEASKNGKYGMVYYTSSIQLANDIQELILKLGYISNIRTRNRGGMKIRNRIYKTQDCYEVSIDQAKKFYIKPNRISKEYYKGLVYCCEVQNNTVLVRRNGFITWCGNSIGVCTVNLPRIGYKSNTEEEFFTELDRLLAICKDSLVIKRKWIQENIIDNKLIPAFIEYVGTIKNHFNTIGVIGMNEMCLNFLGESISTDKGRNFSLKVGEYIREKLLQFQKETGEMFNYEATPAEGCCYSLALKDKKMFPDIITQGKGKDIYYTNSCHLPVSTTITLDEVFKHQEPLQQQFTGGTVIHIYLEGSISGHQSKHIVKSICENYKVPYVSLSPISRYCPEHGYEKNVTDVCSKCGKKVQMYQRITGYLRCVDNFNIGKKQEFKERRQFSNESKADNTGEI